MLTNATTGIDTERLVMDLIDGDFIDDVPDPWVPTVTVPPEVEGLPGLWFWGNTAMELRWHNGGLDLRALATPGARPTASSCRTGRLVGVSGYHRGETLHVHRRPDGSVGHLECATFVYTRTPYDPEAPIPGGHPAPQRRTMTGADAPTRLSPDVAAGAVVHQRLSLQVAELHRREHQIRVGDTQEGVHDARIACRRLRVGAGDLRPARSTPR